MLYNKRNVRKINDKKVLHKVGKHWVTLSIAMLATMGIGFAATGQQAHHIVMPSVSVVAHASNSHATNTVNANKNVNANKQSTNNNLNVNNINKGVTYSNQKRVGAVDAASANNLSSPNEVMTGSRNETAPSNNSTVQNFPRGSKRTITVVERYGNGTPATSVKLTGICAPWSPITGHEANGDNGVKVLNKAAPSGYMVDQSAISEDNYINCPSPLKVQLVPTSYGTDANSTDAVHYVDANNKVIASGQITGEVNQNIMTSDTNGEPGCMYMAGYGDIYNPAAIGTTLPNGIRPVIFHSIKDLMNAGSTYLYDGGTINVPLVTTDNVQYLDDTNSNNEVGSYAVTGKMSAPLTAGDNSGASGLDDIKNHIPSGYELDTNNSSNPTDDTDYGNTTLPVYVKPVNAPSSNYKARIQLVDYSTGNNVGNLQTVDDYSNSGDRTANELLNNTEGTPLSLPFGEALYPEDQVIHFAKTNNPDVNYISVFRISVYHEASIQLLDHSKDDSTMGDPVVINDKFNSGDQTTNELLNNTKGNSLKLPSGYTLLDGDQDIPFPKSYSPDPIDVKVIPTSMLPAKDYKARIQLVDYYTRNNIGYPQTLDDASNAEMRTTGELLNNNEGTSLNLPSNYALFDGDQYISFDRTNNPDTVSVYVVPKNSDYEAKIQLVDSSDGNTIGVPQTIHDNSSVGYQTENELLNNTKGNSLKLPSDYTLFNRNEIVTFARTNNPDIVNVSVVPTINDYKAKIQLVDHSTGNKIDTPQTIDDASDANDQTVSELLNNTNGNNLVLPSGYTLLDGDQDITFSKSNNPDVINVSVAPAVNSYKARVQLVDGSTGNKIDTPQTIDDGLNANYQTTSELLSNTEGNNLTLPSGYTLLHNYQIIHFAKTNNPSVVNVSVVPVANSYKAKIQLVDYSTGNAISNPQTINDASNSNQTVKALLSNTKGNSLILPPGEALYPENQVIHFTKTNNPNVVYVSVIPISLDHEASIQLMDHSTGKEIGAPQIINDKSNTSSQTTSELLSNTKGNNLVLPSSYTLLDGDQNIVFNRTNNPSPVGVQVIPTANNQNKNSHPTKPTTRHEVTIADVRNAAQNDYALRSAFDAFQNDGNRDAAHAIALIRAINNNNALSSNNIGNVINIINAEVSTSHKPINSNVANTASAESAADSIIRRADTDNGKLNVNDQNSISAANSALNSLASQYSNNPNIANSAENSLVSSVASSAAAAASAAHKSSNKPNKSNDNHSSLENLLKLYNLYMGLVNSGLFNS